MKQIKNRALLGDLILLVTAIVWGSSFVAQESGMEVIGPFTFQAIRNMIGSLVLLPVIFLTDRHAQKAPDYHKPTPEQKKTFLRGAIACGVVLFVAANLQQLGMANGTASGKAGFITAFYMLLVPIYGLILGKKESPVVFPCALVALGGLYLLCLKDTSAFGKGDLYCLGCAFVFAIHIMTVSHFAPLVNGLKLACAQFFICGILSGVCMLIFETPSMPDILAVWFPIFYSGAFSCGIAYTLQIIGQKYTAPTIASMIMSLESVFAMLSGLVILHTVPSGAEWIGMVLMFVAIIAVQLLPEWIGKRKAE